MSETTNCGHPKGCLAEIDGDPTKVRCICCHELEGLLAGMVKRLEQDNQALHEQLGKQALILQPGDHRNFDVKTIGYLVMLPGATMHTPDDRVVTRIDPPPNAEAAAKSEREPCPECGKPAEIESIPGALCFGSDDPVRLSCGCETKDREWLKRSHSQDKEHYRRQNRIHKEHMHTYPCPCDRCRAAQAEEPTK